MKLWELLRRRMLEHGEAVAFADAGVSYAELVRAAEEGEFSFGGRLICAEGESKLAQAVQILKILAHGGVAVPVSEYYDPSAAAAVRKLAAKDCGQYNDLAFVVFTGGTTGRPKGVMLTDGNVAANLAAIEEYFAVPQGSRMLIARPLVHISALTGELLFGLYKGLEIYFYEERFMPRRMAKFIDAKKIEVLCCTPTMLKFLADGLQAGSLRTVALSGERLKTEFVRFLKERFAGVNFYNVYGLTENSPRAAALCPQAFFRKPGSIGLPLKDTEMKIKNGELYVKSPSVMLGYYKKKTLTKRRLLGGWLRTGDVAERDADGYFYIRGRKDGMIIRSGVKIFPEEVESAVLQIDGVSECLCYGAEDETYGESVNLKVVSSLSEEKLRGEICRRLPPCMTPKKIEFVLGLPLTAGGKVKR